MPFHDLFAGAANSGRNRHPDGQVREEKWTAKKLGGKGFSAGQVGRGEQRPHGKRRSWFERRYGLIQNIFGRLFFGNFGLGGI